MKPVLIDTNIWSTYLRRNAPDDYQLRFNLELLVQEGRVVFIGPIEIGTESARLGASKASLLPRPSVMLTFDPKFLLYLSHAKKCSNSDFDDFPSGCGFCK